MARAIALGEADYQDQVKVRPTTHAEIDQWVWVEIRRGNKFKGSGKLMQGSPELTAKGLRAGDVIFYAYGNTKNPPRITRKAKVRNQLHVKKAVKKVTKIIAADLAAAMSFNPAPVRHERQEKPSDQVWSKSHYNR